MATDQEQQDYAQRQLIGQRNEQADPSDLAYLNKLLQANQQNAQMVQSHHPILGPLVNAENSGYQALLEALGRGGSAVGMKIPEGYNTAVEALHPTTGGISQAVGENAANLGRYTGAGPLLAVPEAMTDILGGLKQKYQSQQAHGEKATPAEIAKDYVKGAVETASLEALPAAGSMLGEAVAPEAYQSVAARIGTVGLPVAANAGVGNPISAANVIPGLHVKGEVAPRDVIREWQKQTASPAKPTENTVPFQPQPLSKEGQSVLDRINNPPPPGPVTAPAGYENRPIATPQSQTDMIKQWGKNLITGEAGGEELNPKNWHLRKADENARKELANEPKFQNTPHTEGGTSPGEFGTRNKPVGAGPVASGENPAAVAPTQPGNLTQPNAVSNIPAIPERTTANASLAGKGTGPIPQRPTEMEEMENAAANRPTPNLEPPRPLTSDLTRIGVRPSELEEMENLAVQNNPELVRRTGLKAAPESVLQDIEQQRILANEKANEQVNKQRISETPPLHPSLPEELQDIHQSGENWRQNVAEQDILENPPIEHAPYNPSSKEQSDIFNRSLQEDVNTNRMQQKVRNERHTDIKATRAIENEAAGEEKAQKFLDSLHTKETQRTLADEEKAIREANNPGSNSKTNAELRRMVGGAEFEVHKQASRFEPHISTAEKISNNPQARQNWVDTVEKTGKSTIPEMQKLVDENRKTNLEEIAQRQAMGEKVMNSEDVAKLPPEEQRRLQAEGYQLLNPDHIPFMAKPTEKYVGSGSSLQGKEGYRYQRESENRADFENKLANSQGQLELATPNIAKEIQLGHAEVAKSLAFRKTLQDREKAGSAYHVPEGQPPADGWRLLPESLQNDRLINTKPGTKIAIPEADAQAIENYYANSSVKNKGLSAINNVASGIHYLFDTVTAARAAQGEIGNIVEGAMRGDFSEFTKTNSWKVGHDLLTKSIDEMEKNPITSPLVKGLEYISKEGGFRERLRGPEPTTVTGKIQSSANKYNPLLWAAEPMKVGTAAKMGQYALDKVNSGEWSQAEGRKFASDQRKIIDDIFGRERGIHTKNPTATVLQRIATPLYKWETAGARTLGRAGKELVKAKGNIHKTTIPKVFANTVALTGTMAIMGMALSKYYTGHTIVPQTFSDLGKTGRKNPDGSDETVMGSSIGLPLVEELAMMAKGDVGGVANKVVLSNPFFKPVAEAISGWDYQGNRIPEGMARIQHALFGATPIIGRNPDQSVSIPSLFGVRVIPSSALESPAMDIFKEALRETHRSTPADQQPELQQESDWTRRLRGDWDGKQWNQDAYQVEESMRKNGYTPEQIYSLGKLSQIPPGIEGVPYSRIGPQEMLNVWNKASSEEKRKMLPGLQWKFHHLRLSTENAATRNVWNKFYETVSGK